MIFTGVKQAANEKAAAGVAALPVIRVADNGYAIVAERPYSFHPGDHYLTIVLAISPHARLGVGRELVTWMFNSQDKGYSTGHYFPESEAADALADFETRGKRKAAK